MLEEELPVLLEINATPRGFGKTRGIYGHGQELEVTPNGWEGSGGGFHTPLFLVLAKILRRVRNSTSISGKVRELKGTSEGSSSEMRQSPEFKRGTEHQETPQCFKLDQHPPKRLPGKSSLPGFSQTFQ